MGTLPCMTDQAPPKKPKRPRDANELAHRIVEIATGSEPDDIPMSAPDAKDAAAVSLGRRGGLKGGRARADILTQDQRKLIAQRAARARWKKRDDSGNKEEGQERGDVRGHVAGRKGDTRGDPEGVL